MASADDLGDTLLACSSVVVECGFAVDASICCGFVVQLVVPYSKSKTNCISGD